MFGEIGVVNSGQSVISGSNTKIKPEVQENFVKTDSVVKSDETFFSPVIRIDVENQTAILQFRDTETGEVTKEYPSESVKQYEVESKAKEPVAVESKAPEKEPVEQQEKQDFLV